MQFRKIRRRRRRSSTRARSTATRLDSTRLDSFAVDMARSSRAFDGARDALRRASALAAGGGGDARDGGGARGADASARRAVMEALDAHHALSAQAEWAMRDDVRAYAEATEASAAASGARAAAYEALAHVGRSCSARAFVERFGRVALMLGERVKAAEEGEASAETRAACEALRETLTRAGGLVDVPGVRKEASTAISTAAGGLLRMLSQSSVDGFALATTCARAHPGPLRPHLRALEEACGKTVSSCADADARRGAIRCLAALPRIAGDAGSWSEHARRVMYAAHSAMNDAFEGAEDGESKRQLETTLAPQNEPVPKPIVDGKWTLGVIEAVIAMMECLEEMLTSRFACPVNVPCSAATTLVSRALACDGTAISAVPGLPPSPVAPELILALPRIHRAALGVMRALLESARTSALPQGGRVARALEGVLRIGAPTPSDVENGEPIRHCMRVRADAHDTVAVASYALGGAFASGELASAVAAYVIQDSKPCGTGKCALALKSDKNKSGSKKRKKGGTWGSATAEGLDDLTTAAVLDDMSGPTAGSAALDALRLQTSALRAIAALCTTGGAMIIPGIRSRMDAAVAQAATHCCDLASPWIDTDASRADRRQAALDALLASVLAPRPFRSPNLPLAVSIFSKGSHEQQTSRQCLRASLALNALLHPAAPPLASQAIAPPVERAEPGGAAATPQWGSLMSIENQTDRADAADALRASVADYYKTSTAEPVAPPAVEPPETRADGNDDDTAPAARDDDAHDLHMDDASTVAPAPTQKPDSTSAFRDAPTDGFASAAAGPAFAAPAPVVEPPDDFISFSAPTSARSNADMWETAREPVGLGTGASKVPVELSDDSDGELPEIHSGGDDDDSDENDDDDDENDDDDDENE